MRRVLFDEDMPRQLRRDLPEFSIRTVQEEGWSALKNGELLRRASEKFDVLVTADQCRINRISLVSPLAWWSLKP